MQVFYFVFIFCIFIFCFFFFFFQAEDGIRDRNVTGVQTCALPILKAASTISVRPDETRSFFAAPLAAPDQGRAARDLKARSEERRVGKECRSRGSPYH